MSPADFFSPDNLRAMLLNCDRWNALLDQAAPSIRKICEVGRFKVEDLSAEATLDLVEWMQSGGEVPIDVLAYFAELEKP